MPETKRLSRLLSEKIAESNSYKAIYVCKCITSKTYLFMTRRFLTWPQPAPTHTHTSSRYAYLHRCRILLVYFIWNEINEIDMYVYEMYYSRLLNENFGALVVWGLGQSGECVHRCASFQGSNLVVLVKQIHTAVPLQGKGKSAKAAASVFWWKKVSISFHLDRLNRSLIWSL